MEDGADHRRHLLASPVRVDQDLASLVRVDQDLRQAAPAMVGGALHPVGDIRPRAVERVARVGPRVHHHPVATGDMEAGAHTGDGDHLVRLLLASLVRVDQDLASPGRVDQDLRQAAHQEINGALHPVGDIRHLAVASLVNQVVASQARADPRAHHPAVETGVTAAGDHTEDGDHLRLLLASLVRVDQDLASLGRVDQDLHQAAEIGAQEDGVV